MTRERVDLTSYVGMASDVRIRFEMGTDHVSSGDAGWNIDDVTIDAYGAVPRYLTTHFYYDENGNLLEVNDATDNSSYYLYDVYGNLIPEIRKDMKVSANKYVFFATHSWNPWIKLNLNLGVRVDYFSYNQNYHFSPRFSFSYKISDKTSFNGAAGVFQQNLPLVLLFQNEAFKGLKDPVSYHFIAGITHLLTKNTRLTIEVYDKEYEHVPLDPNQPLLFILDEFFHPILQP